MSDQQGRTVWDPRTRLIGRSPAIEQVHRDLERLASVDWPVVFLGPRGSGKGLAARLLHEMSRRARGPFVNQSLTMLVSGVEFAQLIGHARGAFTGAVRDMAGVFEQAHGGTLFLDEIASASAIVQGALLQLLEDGSVCRLGEQRRRPVDVRLAFATNEDLGAAVLAGKFRADLLDRLGALIVRMPPLAKRRQDIPAIAIAAFECYARRITTREVPELSDADFDRLLLHDWPGNVRELENVITYFVVHGRLPEFVETDVRPEVWRARVDDTIRRHSGNKAAAARELGVSRKTLYAELHRRARIAQSESIV